MIFVVLDTAELRWTHQNKPKIWSVPSQLWMPAKPEIPGLNPARVILLLQYFHVSAKLVQAAHSTQERGQIQITDPL